ncbi:hypothetical protein LguiB_013181 [Lonicera macranthoides]
MARGIGEEEELVKGSKGELVPGRLQKGRRNSVKEGSLCICCNQSAFERLTHFRSRYLNKRR